MSAARCLPPAQVRRLVEAVRDGVRREDVARSHSVGTTRLARIIAEHAPELVRRPTAQRGGGLTKVRREHLERLARGPAPLVSDPTRQFVLMPGALLNRVTVAWLAERGLVTVTSTRPRVASITPVGRDALARGAL